MKTENSIIDIVLPGIFFGMTILMVYDDNLLTKGIILFFYGGVCNFITIVFQKRNTMAKIIRFSLVAAVSFITAALTQISLIIN